MCNQIGPSFITGNETINYKIWYFSHPVKWAMSWENLLMPYTNNKGADQPAHPCSLISAFVVHCLDSIVPLVSIPEISSLYLASVAVQAGLCLPGRKPWSRFSHDEAQIDFLQLELCTRQTFGPSTTMVFWLKSDWFKCSVNFLFNDSLSCSLYA